MSFPLTGTGSGAPEALATGPDGAPTVVLSGVASYLLWGVDDVIPDYSYLTILRATQEPLVENIPIPNGSGVQAGRVDVISGFTLNVTLRDDRRMSALHVGDQVTIVDMGGLLPGRLRGETCTGYVRSPNFEGAAKQAGEKVVVLEYLSLVEGAGL